MLPPTITTKRIIKRFGPLQLGKILAVFYGLMGLLFIPFFLIMALVSTQAPGQHRAPMAALGIGFAFIFPFLYAAMGFVFGIIGALLYNLVASWIGGIEVEVE